MKLQTILSQSGFVKKEGTPAYIMRPLHNPKGLFCPIFKSIFHKSPSKILF